MFDIFNSGWKISLKHRLILDRIICEIITRSVHDVSRESSTYCRAVGLNQCIYDRDRQPDYGKIVFERSAQSCSRCAIASPISRAERSRSPVTTTNPSISIIPILNHNIRPMPSQNLSQPIAIGSIIGLRLRSALVNWGWVVA